MKFTSVFETRYQKNSTHSPLDRLYRRIVCRQLQSMNKSCLKIIEGDDVITLGSRHTKDEEIAIIHVQHPECWRLVLHRGSIGAAEAFMNGSWTSPDLVRVVQVFCRNFHILSAMDKNNLSFFKRSFLRISESLHRNTLEGSRHNIAAHYDLGNDFFSTFLDATMMYSSAIYQYPEQNLYDASVNKLDVTCQKLNLTPADHVLEIGTGWGSMAIHAAEHYGCKVTTTTISKEQFDYACEAVEAKNLNHLVTVLFRDYRELSGQYDKIVSIEMIEAVGAEYYDTFFDQCHRLLKPRGQMLIQAITMPDESFERYRDSMDFIRRYIFPGGCLPSIAVLEKHAEQDDKFVLTDIHDITIDYAKTLAAWREAFMHELHKIKRLGFDENFIRMWHYYLSYCEGGFRERHSTTHQLLFTR